MYPYTFNHLSTEEHLECFPILVIMNKLLQTFVCRFLHKHKFQLLWARSTKECSCWNLCRGGLVFSFLKKATKLFSKVAVLFYIPMSDEWTFLSLYIPHQNLGLSVFQILAILIDMQWYFFFNLNFSHQIWFRVSFHMFAFHLYLFFWNVSV